MTPAPFPPPILPSHSLHSSHTDFLPLKCTLLVTHKSIALPSAWNFPSSDHWMTLLIFQISSKTSPVREIRAQISTNSLPACPTHLSPSLSGTTCLIIFYNIYVRNFIIVRGLLFVRPKGQECYLSHLQLCPSVGTAGTTSICESIRILRSLFQEQIPGGPGSSSERGIKSPGWFISSASHSAVSDLAHRFLHFSICPPFLWDGVRWRGNQSLVSVLPVDSLLRDPQRALFPLGKNSWHVSLIPSVDL